MANSNFPIPLSGSDVWAIPISNSEYRTWTDIDNAQSKVVFQWKDISIPAAQTRESTLIAVAKANPGVPESKIRSIANGIINFLKISQGDTIFAIDGSKEISRFGYASEVTKDRASVTANIVWRNELTPMISAKPLFKADEEIQRVTLATLRFLGLESEFDEKFTIDLLEEPHSYNAYRKALIRDKIVEKEDKGGSVKLYFGTNRVRTGSTDFNNFYGNELGILQHGTCEVKIPRGHEQGEIERPKRLLLIQFPEKEGVHFVISDILSLKETDFLRSLSNDLKEQPDKSAFIFVHGYNTSFAEAAWRTAQIAWDVPFYGPAGFFSWPSSGKTISYAADIEKADASIPQFEEFIKLFTINTGIEKLHLIAHSMGNRIMTITLNNLSRDTDYSKYIHIINQIVLGAPDLDKEAFNNTILPIFKTIGSGRTLYASDKDKALNVSAMIRGGRTRIGDTKGNIYITKGIDTIDASNVPSRDNNHSYIFETKELLSDLYYLLGKGLPPDQRRLRKIINKDGMNYWLFPK